jgi:hypothetical protein
MKKVAIGLYVAITLALLAWGYYQAIYVAPDDAMQGELFRIIYYHVPSFAAAFTFFSVSSRSAFSAPSDSFLFVVAVRSGRKSPTRGRWPEPRWASSSARLVSPPAPSGAAAPPRLGHLVDMGRAADHYPGVVADLCQLFAAAPLCGRAADADAGCGAGHLWRARRAHRLHVQPLVADPASSPGFRRRLGLGDGPDDGLRSDVEYARVAAMGLSHSRPALSRRTPAPEIRRARRAGSA